ncbi:MAG: type II toxin-antitoxin system VapC family toxin, partial [Verrucomicrobia bacterium]|nr:type II toxin-antitoxin system VapC family toxin [Verrucomicrobiota bacterium]
HKLLLDTHVWIWLMGGNSSLSRQFRTAVDNAQKHDGILISAISVWEIGMLVEKKRIEIEMDTLDWVETSLSSKGVKLVPLTPRISILSSRLPGTVHGDPADRLLVASAHEENAVLVTCDQKLISYGQDRFISVYNPLKQA